MCIRDRYQRRVRERTRTTTALPLPPGMMQEAIPATPRILELPFDDISADMDFERLLLASLLAQPEFSPCNMFRLAIEYRLMVVQARQRREQANTSHGDVMLYYTCGDTQCALLSGYDPTPRDDSASRQCVKFANRFVERFLCQVARKAKVRGSRLKAWREGAWTAYHHTLARRAYYTEHMESADAAALGSEYCLRDPQPRPLVNGSELCRVSAEKRKRGSVEVCGQLECVICGSGLEEEGMELDGHPDAHTDEWEPVSYTHLTLPTKRIV
eukprot:TRINITY_DN4536_c0_g1_i2.p1 TRINITY_DN4536_c0_g1~~TRINITY_DN4536_c0_g1_i2.p1  ORF type:complete len:271 (+),score=49.20 TRINITY_DN4536_c0_g1_i2:28-840(+)